MFRNLLFLFLTLLFLSVLYFAFRGIKPIGEGLKRSYDIFLDMVAMLGAAIAFVFTIYTWQKTNVVKRAEFLESLIKEQNGASTLLARRVLDDFWIDFTADSTTPDQILIERGNSVEIKEGGLKQAHAQLLRYHWDNPVTNIVQQRVRHSFDELLDFFVKLEYYKKLDLITVKELQYFRYYLQKCASNEAVLNYAEKYGFAALFDLLRVMQIPRNNTVGSE